MLRVGIGFRIPSVHALRNLYLQFFFASRVRSPKNPSSYCLSIEGRLFSVWEIFHIFKD